MFVKILPILTSALSKEETEDTPGDQEPYDPGVRRGSNYKTPMERFKSIKVIQSKEIKNLQTVFELNTAGLIFKIHQIIFQMYHCSCSKN